MAFLSANVSNGFKLWHLKRQNFYIYQYLSEKIYILKSSICLICMVKDKSASACQLSSLYIILAISYMSWLKRLFIHVQITAYFVWKWTVTRSHNTSIHLALNRRKQRFSYSPVRLPICRVANHNILLNLINL